MYKINALTVQNPTLQHICSIAAETPLPWDKVISRRKWQKPPDAARFLNLPANDDDPGWEGLG